MESAGWVQKHHETCDLTHKYWSSDDVRTCEQETVQCSTTDTPKENLSSSQRWERDRQYPSQTQWCETPKLTKKSVSLRRHLLTSKSMTDVKTSISGTPGQRDTYTLGASDSPDIFLSGPISYSTLRSDVASVSCMKRRLVFSQAVTSTLEDGSDRTSPSLSEPDLDESIISGLLPSETPEMLQERDGFRSPVTCLAADLSESLSVLSIPSHTPFSRLDTSEDSGFGSLRLDSLEDAGDGSFQEGASRVSLSRDIRRARLEHQRRLSTLKEGSQSDEEVKGQHESGQGIKLEQEVFAESPTFGEMQHDMSLTPALQAMEALSRSFTLAHDFDRPISTYLNVSHDLDLPIAARLSLSHLIGRKMGLGRMDVLTELHMRDLHHVLSSILQLLSAKEIYMCTRVCDSWSDIILQDRKANRRRKMYEREQKHALEMGVAVRVVDAETRLALPRRLALSSVQAQAKTSGAHTRTPAASGTRTRTPAASGAHTNSAAASGAHTNSAAASGAHTRTPAASGTHTRTPAASGTHTRTPASSGPHTRTPASSGAHTRTPASSGAHTRTPASSGAHTRTPAASGAHTRTPASSGAHTRTPAASGAHTCTPAASGAHTRTPAAIGTHTNSAAASCAHTYPPAASGAHTNSAAAGCTRTPAASCAHTHTPAVSNTHTHTPPSTKRQQFLQVAKTLFGDECLRPCPRCERPARCHSVKAEGVCSWSECVFHFCTSCLRAYHGSTDCARLPSGHTRRKGRSQLLPGSAQSKRNVKRL